MFYYTYHTFWRDFTLNVKYREQLVKFPEDIFQTGFRGQKVGQPEYKANKIAITRLKIGAFYLDSTVNP